MIVKEIEEIKKLLYVLMEKGYIFNPRKNEFKGLGINDTFYLKIEGGIK